MNQLYQEVQKIISFLDPHIALQLIQFYEQKNILQKDWLHKEKIAVLMKTKLYTQLEQEVNKFQKIDGISQKIKDMQNKDIEDITFVDQVETFINQVSQKFPDIKEDQLNKQALSKQFEMKSEYSASIITKARFLYEIGQYKEALQLIIVYLICNGEEDKSYLRLLWGKINSEILISDIQNKVEKVKEDLKTIKDKIELQQDRDYSFKLNQRSFLIHLTIYTLFQCQTSSLDFEQMLELILTQDQYIATMQITSPYLIKYLICAVLLSKNFWFNDKHGQLILTLLQKNCFDYQDAFTEYFKELLINLNFEAMKTLIQKIEHEIQADFFLAKHQQTLLKNIQYLYFETYCKVFGEIKIEDISQFLGNNNDFAEQWIVSLFNQSNIQAKIDSQNGYITIKKKNISYNDEVQNQIKELVQRTGLIVTNMKRI